MAGLPTVQGGKILALVTLQRRRLEVPHEAGQFFELQPLTGAQRDLADNARTKAVLSLFEGVDERLLDRMTKTEKTEEPAAKVDDSELNLGKYDLDVVIKYGLVNWSYDVPCNDEAKAQLDAQTRDWAAMEILKMSVRTLPESVASSAG